MNRWSRLRGKDQARSVARNRLRNQNLESLLIERASKSKTKERKMMVTRDLPLCFYRGCKPSMCGLLLQSCDQCDYGLVYSF